MREVNQSELATILPLTTRQIRNLEKEGMPHRAEGRHKLYPLPDAVEWYARYREGLARAELESTDYEEAKARREAARARMAEMEVAEREGELLTREDVERIYGDQMLDMVRASLQNAPGRWGAQIVGLESPREGEAAIKEIVAETLEHLSGPAADELARSGGERALPEDFPGRGYLEQAGIETIGAVRASGDLRSIRGIGPATERKILDALEELDAA